MIDRSDVTTFEQLQTMSPAQRSAHFRASIITDLDDLTARERELLEEQNRRVPAHEEHPRGSEPRTKDV
jgi:hypothetical protein